MTILIWKEMQWLSHKELNGLGLGWCFSSWSPQHFLQFLEVYQHWQLAEHCYCCRWVAPCLWRSSPHFSECPWSSSQLHKVKWSNTLWIEGTIPIYLHHNTHLCSCASEHTHCAAYCKDYSVQCKATTQFSITQFYRFLQHCITPYELCNYIPSTGGLELSAFHVRRLLS